MTFFYMITFTIWFLWTLLDSLRSLYLIRFCGIRRSLSVQTASRDVKLGMFKWRTVACVCAILDRNSMQLVNQYLSKALPQEGLRKHRKLRKGDDAQGSCLWLPAACLSFLGFTRLRFSIAMLFCPQVINTVNK